MKIYTREDWKHDGIFKAAAGQQIEKNIYDEMENCLPPLDLPQYLMQAYDKGFQIPEAEDHYYDENANRLRAVYPTFGVRDGKCYHIGPATREGMVILNLNWLKEA